MTDNNYLYENLIIDKLLNNFYFAIVLKCVEISNYYY